jgi:hypothetical protein
MFITVLLLAFAADSDARLDWLAQSKAGKALCSNPDEASKTCSSIASYKIAPDGSAMEISEVLLAPNQALTLVMSVTAEVEGNSSCGTLTEANLGRAKVRMGGEDFPPDRNSLALNRLKVNLQPFFGKKACDTLRVEGGGLVKYGQVEGVDMKMGKPIMWISPTDGYKVAPRP